MERIKEVVSGTAMFFAINLAINLGMYLLASGICLYSSSCTGVQWSEYMFWLSMLAMIAAMPIILASMNTSRGYFDNPLTAGQDMKVASTIIKHERRELSSRTVFMLRMLTTGATGMVISALIEILTRTTP
ncbi:MAG: hypothetical protein P1S60_19955 [Anaerolineae bacterium]|nr:hypothetical protein [Anaerolineae bacterium]